MNVQDTPETDPKLMAILSAAANAFGLYGFRRTSMEDIAKGANMSRAALYLHFKNKEDIFRSLVAGYYAQAAHDLKDALAAEGSVADRLKAGFTALSGESFEQILNSPHGAELLDAKATASGDAVDAGVAGIVAVLATWLEDEQAAGRVDHTAIAGSASELATTMVRAYYGLKEGPPKYEDFVRERDQLTTVYGKALAV